MLFNYHYAFIPDFITAIAIPILMLIWFWKGKTYTKLDLLMKNLVVGSYLIMIFYVANWWFFSYYFRYAFLLFFIIGSFIKWRKLRTKTWFQSYNFLAVARIAASLIFTISFSFFSYTFISSYHYDDVAVELQFPLRNGAYSIFQGGNGENSTLMNYHYTFPIFQQSKVHDSMQYAVDIEKVNILGTTRRGLFLDDPSKFNNYEIFGEIIYSPVDGVVVSVEDTSADVSPGANNAKGNSIVIKTKDDLYITLLHLKSKSILIKVGDELEKGQPIAEVGTSGTGFPHLHIHASKRSPWGIGVPIRFDGRFVVKNNIIFN